jgi:hypothetical protein
LFNARFEETEYLYVAAVTAALTFLGWQSVPENVPISCPVKTEDGSEGLGMVVGDAVGVAALQLVWLSGLASGSLRTSLIFGSRAGTMLLLLRL